MTHQFTLTEIQDVEYGHVLGQEDLDYANELLAQGKSYGFVRNCIEAWANEIERVSNAETEDARRFEQWSY